MNKYENIGPSFHCRIALLIASQSEHLKTGKSHRGTPL